MKKILITGFTLLFVFNIWSQNIQITQVDTNDLLFRGEINIYFSLTGTESRELSVDDFTVIEKSEGELDIVGLKNEPNRDAGIDFILLIDNSGSMYEERYEGSRRINQAKLALGSFLDQIDDSKDRVAVYSFNTRLQEVAPFGTGIPDIHRSLSAIEEPDTGMSYTELYHSLKDIPKAFPKTSGRRAVIVLSDGENYSLFEHAEIKHEDWGESLVDPEEIVLSYYEAGITLDGINLSDQMDANLAEICRESGGKFHDVRTTEAISGVYSDIREKITNEYQITVKAPPLQNPSGVIELAYKGKQDSRILVVPTLFGGVSRLPVIIPLIILIIGLAGVGILYYLPFEKPVKGAQIQALDSNMTIALNNEVTVIGASREADFTMAGNPGIEAEHATIVHDENAATFILSSKRPVRVNNKKVRKRKLTPGDVIQIEGSTIIFDAPEPQKSKAGAKVQSTKAT
ncbi:MAG: VWA domain-containing protein [Spirochaetales bacterium]|nr:VWA domain-containing protein [Spirochaetales bacterium]